MARTGANGRETRLATVKLPEFMGPRPSSGPIRRRRRAGCARLGDRTRKLHHPVESMKISGAPAGEGSSVSEMDARATIHGKYLD